MTTITPRHKPIDPLGRSASQYGSLRHAIGPANVAINFIIGAYVVVTAAIPYQYGRYLLVGLIAALMFAILQRQKFSVASILWPILLSSLGIFGSIIGDVHGNPGVSSTMSVFVYEPLIIGMLFGIRSSSPSWAHQITRILDIALIAVSTLGALVYIAPHLGLSIPTFLVNPKYTAISVTDANLRTNFQGYNCLIFLAPYGIYQYLRLREHGRSATWRAILLAAALASILLSGRRILFLTVPLALIVSFLAFRQTNRNRRRTHHAASGSTLLGLAIAMLSIAAVMKAVGVGFLGAFSRTLAHVTFTDPSGIRAHQSQVLLAAWQSRPVFGYGTGAVVSGYIRDATTPWAYELSYHVILLNFGIVGLLLLTAWGGWTTMRLLRAGRAGSTVAQVIFCAWLCTVTSAAVDPYLFKIDGMWMVFIPFGIAAFGLQQKQHTD